MKEVNRFPHPFLDLEIVIELEDPGENGGFGCKGRMYSVEKSSVGSQKEDSKK